MNIPYTYLAVLLVFTLLVGVVIGDRLAAGAGVRSGNGPGVEGSGPGRSGGCAGLASARLHACVHRYGRRPHRRAGAHSGSDTLEPWHHTAASCGLETDAE